MHEAPPKKRSPTTLQKIGCELLRFALMILMSLGTLVGMAAVTLTFSVLIGILAFVYDWSPLWTLVPFALALLALKLWELYDLSQAPRDLIDAFRRFRHHRDEKTDDVD
ncbi:MAG TPA: hypothetical protein PLX09_01415 [Xanthomonadaceae bacterium]|nr:hypothetical protein [Xanthomonadaceae bacterium]